MNRTMAVLFLACALAVAMGRLAGSATPPPQQPSVWQLVAKDFSAGMAGDQAALNRVLATCDSLLQKQPKAAAPRAVQGSCWLCSAGQAYRQGNWQQGQQLYQRGLARMDEAVSLAPNDPEVLMTRGMALIGCGLNDPRPETRTPLLTKGTGDLSAVAQQPGCTKWPAAERGRLLLMLGDGLAELGRTDQARSHYQRVARECAGTYFAQEANKRLAQ